MKDLLRRLGQRIRELRLERGWSQEEFADVCGVHRTYMGHLERGEKNVSFNSIVRVATALDVSLSTLFAGLENGEMGVLPAQSGNPKTSSLDRTRLLKELRTIERSLSKLRELGASEAIFEREGDTSLKTKRPRRG